MENQEQQNVEEVTLGKDSEYAEYDLDMGSYTMVLNKRVEKQVIRLEKVCAVVGDNGCATFKEINIYGFRVNPNLPRSCALLASSASYTA